MGHSVDELKEQIRRLLDEGGLRAAKVNDILRALKLPPTEKGTVRRLLRELAAEGHLAKLQSQKFTAARRTRTVVGRLRMSSRGFGFVIPEPETKEEADGTGPEIDERRLEDARPEAVFIPRRRMGDALHGDRVRVIVTGETERSPEGQVLEVLERGTSRVVGTFFATRRGGTVFPRDLRFNRTITTPRPSPALGLSDGDWVVAEVTGWTKAPDPLLGRVRERLGDTETAGIDVTVIVRDAGVEPEFPADVLAEAEAIPTEIPPEEIARRTDFRGLPTFTMDGPTAKDFDDALSIERLPQGGWRLGVHIADVSYYVREGSPLDREAYERATSIYPVDRVVPMLPEKLSNNVCSLRPREDRLTLSCLMDIDRQGRVHHYSIHQGIIRSAHRLVYEDVQAVIENRADPALARELGDIRLQLEDLYELRRVLTEMRLRRGALDLDIAETEILFEGDRRATAPSRDAGVAEMEFDHGRTVARPDDMSPEDWMNRRVTGIVRRARLESHRVVEECMLIANEVVASHLFNLRIPSVYRVHEPPDTNKLRQIQPVLAQLGVRFPSRKDIDAVAIQTALDKAARLETGFIARRLILRAMMRARYADENLGHYGLGSTCYTHFTSPIRRYPDLLVHRLLRETMEHGAPTEGLYAPPGEPDDGGVSLTGLEISEELAPRPARRGRRDERVPEPESTGSGRRTASEDGRALPARRIEHYARTLPRATAHCSELERRAEEIEDDATRLKALEFMRGFLGEEFDGLITGVSPFGIFVELVDLPVEGMVHVSNLKGDFYEFDEERMILVGRTTGETFKLGDRLLVAVENVDVAQLQLDFSLARKYDKADSAERRAELHRLRQQKQRRHAERRPRHGGFQARGKRRGRR